MKQKQNFFVIVIREIIIVRDETDVKQHSRIHLPRDPASMMVDKKSRDLDNHTKSKLIDDELRYRDGKRRANKLWNR